MIYIDARSRHGNNRLTVFSDTLEDLLRQYQDWVKECKFVERDIWYANIFELGSDRHIGVATIEEGSAIRYNMVRNSKLSPYHRSIRQMYDYFFKR